MLEKLRTFVLLVAVCIGAAALYVRRDIVAPQLMRSYKRLVTRPNLLATAGAESIRLHTPEELDFLTKEQVLARRRAAVESSPELFQPPYQPSEEIFGDITDGRPWWGIDGLYYFGPGQRGIDGLSEESRFILNPFLLVGLMEGRAYVTDLAPSGQVSYPNPLSLTLDLAAKRAVVHYDVGAYFEHLKRISNNEPALTLVAYNARDFGFHYLRVNEGASSGVRWMKTTKEPEPIAQFIHTGGSCGYPGGCNNMSPFQEGMVVELVATPAKIEVELWREEPKDQSSSPDFRVSLEVSGSL